MSYNNGDFGEASSTAGMFSYPSSPLFEQPFSNRDFYAEQTPLRARGSGGGGGENDAFYAANNNTGGSNPFSDSSSRRKRSLFQHSPDRWVKHVMKFVLLSPVVVLVAWSAIAVLFTGSRRQTSAQQPKAQSTLIVQPKSLSSSSKHSARENLEEGLLEGIEMVSEALGEAQPLPNVQPMLALPQQQQPLQGSSLQQQQPLGQAVQIQQPLQQSSIQIQQPMGQVLQQQQLMGQTSQVQQPLQQASVQLQEPMGQAMQQQQPLGQATTVQLQQALGDSAQVQQQPLQGSAQPQHKGFFSILEPSNSGKNKKKTSQTNKLVDYLSSPHRGISNGAEQQTQQQLQAAGPQLRGTGNKKIVYYYYDPRDTSVGPGGQVVLPSVLYDESGNAMDSSHIQQASKIYLQPPPLYGSSSTYYHPNVVSGRIKNPKKSFAMPSTDSFTKAVQQVEQQDGGSSVIVATVAVMALLVGAVSARKLRGAGALANCIENERLDHVAAYDTATENNTAYSTFHWKGDLEKFDV
eukprot:CAMPEP_0172454968 /NCGR_PEP_ID=MMETSP1065-20121228/11798_1 /TAXON_ID=265537 /ORGANISM="Amphiprora paludosa, Strain CCMP125" /LENGTH=519 /DNA_ID=CAMNT_0013207391 /DNA_START=188 /DNA_END=1747 /DNA_ORIENTATION=-